MAELTLLVNSTDTALLNGNAAAPVATSGAAAGGFAGILGKRLTQGEGVAVTESPSQADAARSITVAETGELRPVSGKPLPLVESQDSNPVLDASLLSAITQGIPAVNGQSVNVSSTSAIAPIAGFVRERHEGVPQSALSQRVSASPVTENSTSSTLLNMTLNPHAAANSSHNILPVLPGAAQEMQRANIMPIIPAATAQQTLVYASLNAGTAHSLRTDMMSATGQIAVNAQHNSGLSGTLTDVNNHSVGNAMRMDMFAAAMGAATQSGAGANTEMRLVASSATSTVPVSLIATSALSEDTNNLLTGISRSPGAIINGVSSMLTISTPVAQSAWASELGQRVTWLANSELREAQLQLNPRSLGAVDVRIVYGPEQQLSVSFSAANPVARDALDAALPRLREMFEQQGLNLADASISHESPEERQQRNSMNNESLITIEEETIDAASLHSSSSSWLSEGILDAYA